MLASAATAYEIPRGKAITTLGRRYANRAMMFNHPSGQHRLGGLFEPLIDQNGDFTPQVRSVVQPREFKALKGRTRSRMQVVDGGHDARYRHGQTPMWNRRNQHTQQATFRYFTDVARIVSSTILGFVDKAIDCVRASIDLVKALIPCTHDGRVGGKSGDEIGGRISRQEVGLGLHSGENLYDGEPMRTSSTRMEHDSGASEPRTFEGAILNVILSSDRFWSSRNSLPQSAIRP